MNEEIKKILIDTFGEDAAKPYIKHLDSLADDSRWLSCLEAAGVDNWSGYDDAREMYNEEQ